MALGFTRDEAMDVEYKYHALYVESDEWVQRQLDQAAIDGYVTVAFGMRLRTPLLKKCLMGSSKTPYEAKAEGRTAGNALGQSYCMLNNRAGIELQERTLNSGFRTDVLPVAHIHDAQYFMVRNNFGTVKWLNDNLGECMAWQELPEIVHDEVKLSGELDIFYPNWSKAITLPNNISKSEIKKLIREKTNG